MEKRGADIAASSVQPSGVLLGAAASSREETIARLFLSPLVCLLFIVRCQLLSTVHVVGRICGLASAVASCSYQSASQTVLLQVNHHQRSTATTSTRRFSTLHLSIRTNRYKWASNSLCDYINRFRKVVSSSRFALPIV